MNIVQQCLVCLPERQMSRFIACLRDFVSFVLTITRGRSCSVRTVGINILHTVIDKLPVAALRARETMIGQAIRRLSLDNDPVISLAATR